MYLIMKCKELNDQYECDADRIPMFITDDWEKNIPDYCYEVYEILDDGKINLLIDYENAPAREQGIIFGFWYYEGDVQKWKTLSKFLNRTRDNKIPINVQKTMPEKDKSKLYERLKCFGRIYWNSADNSKKYAYEEYDSRSGIEPY